MLVSLIIVFREVLEAGLIVGIVLAATEGVTGRGGWIAGGVAAGVAGSALVAAFTAALSDAFEGTGQEVFTAAILLFAVAMLTWHIVFMSRHARVLTAELRTVGTAVRLGQRSLAALAAVVAVAVMREGSEVVLFLFGVAAASKTSVAAMVLGGVGGMVLAGLVSWLLYRGLVAIPLSRLFSVTNWLIALLAAGMAGQAAAVLHGADLLPGWGEQLWDTSALLSDDSLIGKSLHALVGYEARPSGIQLAAWAVTLGLLVVLSRLASGKRVRTAAAAAGMALLLAAPIPARAEEAFSLTLRNHRFEPDRLDVPANVKFRLTVHNADDTADEFDSTDLNREKIIPGGRSGNITLGPLKPGEYKFMGEFHSDTAQGVLVAK